MGLSLQPTRRISRKIATLIAVFALIAQPMYGLVAERVANAAVGDPVCVSGGDCYSTIQEAIDNPDTTTGSTITIAPGVYSGAVTITKSLTIAGPGATVNGQIKIEAPGADVTISGLTIRPAGETVAVKVPSKVSLKSLTLDGLNISSFKSVHIADGASSVGTLTITNSAITSNYPVYIDHVVTSLNVTNNQFVTVGGYSTNGDRGVVLAKQPPSSVVAFSGNTFTVDPSANLTNMVFFKYQAVDPAVVTQVLNENTFQLANGTPVSVGTSTGGEAIVVVPDTKKPTGSAEYKGGYLDSDNIRYVRSIEDLSFTASISDNIGVARATYRAINVDHPSTEACGNWNAGSTTNHNFAAPLQLSTSYIVPGSSIKTCDPSMKWQSGSLYKFVHAAYDEANNEGKFNVPTQQLVEIDRDQPIASGLTAPSTASKTLNLSAKATDEGSGVESMRFYVAEMQNGVCKNNYPAISEAYSQRITAAVNGKYSASIDVSALADGEYCILASARDNVMNNSNQPLFQKVTIDNTAPKITSVEFDEIRSYNGPNFTGSKLNSNKLVVTFTTNEALKISSSQMGMKIPALPGIPATGWTKVQLVDASTNKYTASIDLTNRTDTSNTNYKPDFFKDKFFENINLYFQLTDALNNNKNTYYAIDPTTNKPIDDWTTNANDARNFKLTLDNKAPVLSVVDQDFSKPLSNNDSIIVKATDDSGVRVIHANVRKVNASGTVEKDAIDGLGFEFDRNNVLREVNHAVKLGDLMDGSGLESGKYQFRISGQDITLNNSGQQNFLFTVNNQAPKAIIAVGSIDSGDITNNKDIAITGTGVPSEYGTDIKTHYFELKTPATTHHIYSFNNAAGKTCALNGTNECSFNLTDYYDVDGRYEVRYVVTDQQGLRNDGHQQPWVKNTEVARFLFSVDSTDPTVSISSNHDGFVSDYNSWKDARNVMVTVEDTNLGKTSLYKASDDSTVKTYTNDGTAFSIGIGLAEGVYYLVHTDQAGNESTKAHFTISNKKPAIYDIKGLNPDDTTVVGPGGITTQFKVGNGDSLAATVDQVMVRGWIYDISKPNNRGAAAFSNQGVDSSVGEYDIDLESLLGDKFVHGAKFVIMLQAKNTANVHDQQTFILEVDLQAPVVTINSYAQPFTTGTPMIEGTVDDTAAGVDVSRDSGISWEAANYTPGGTTWSFTYPSTLVNGNHTILARATDEYGNRTADSALARSTFAVNTSSTTSRQTNDPPSPLPDTSQDLTLNFQQFPASGTVIDDATVETEADEAEEGEVVAATTDGDEDGEVKAAEDVKEGWSLINLLLTIAVAAASIFALIGLAGKKEDRNIGARLLTVVPALGAGAVLLFAEDFSGQMSWVNIWTLLVGALLVVQMILLANTKTETE